MPPWGKRPAALDIGQGNGARHREAMGANKD